MRDSTVLDNLATLEEAAPPGALTSREAPAILVDHGPAGNDATCEDPPLPSDGVDSWAQRALTSSRFGDTGITDADPSARRTGYPLHQQARATRSLALGEIIVATIGRVVAAARGVYARHRQRRQMRAIQDAFRELDDHTLRDLGFDRSEITSVAAEATGEAERTRVRVLLMPHGL